MIENKKYDLEERTYQFAKNVAIFCKKLPLNLPNTRYIPQVLDSSSSIAANYIEANESLGKKDFVMRVKICRKEAKETVFWLRLIADVNTNDFKDESISLKNEAVELRNILSSIISKSS
jgi:four helix bundle protein